MNTDIRTFVFVITVIVSWYRVIEGCKSAEWRNMTMEEILLKSDLVVYGRDSFHGKLRNPEELDSRFTVYCLIKSGNFKVPGTLVIQNIRDSGRPCSGVAMQTLEGNEYIVGLTPTVSGFVKYAEVNVLQKSAFPATNENFERLAAICDLDDWQPPVTGDQEKCPTPSKPRFCTKIRDPVTSGGDRRSVFMSLYLMTLLLIVYY